MSAGPGAGARPPPPFCFGSSASYKSKEEFAPV